MSHEYPNSLDLCHWSITHIQKICSFYYSETMAAEAPLGKASLIIKSIQVFLCESHKIWKPSYRNEVIKCFYCGVVKNGQSWDIIIRAWRAGEVCPVTYRVTWGMYLPWWNPMTHCMGGSEKKSKFSQFLQTLNMPKYHVWGSCVLIPITNCGIWDPE